jgi:sirohydrochlorin ferrochelatase
MLLGHGSPDPAGRTELVQLRGLVSSRLGAAVGLCVLEFPAPGLPGLEEALASVAAGGEVSAQPLILFDGRHGRRDIPRATRRASRARGIDIRLGTALGEDPALVRLAAGRLAECGPRAGDVLLFVGRGSSDPEALRQAEAVASAVAGPAMLDHLVCYTGISRPTLAEGLGAALERRPGRVLALPYLLHGGVLARRVEEVLAPLARTAGVPLVVLPHIGNGPALVGLVAARLEALR